MGEPGATPLPNIQKTGAPKHTGCRKSLQLAEVIAGIINDDEECVVEHIAGHCHRSHKQGVCDLGPGRGDRHQNPFLLLHSLCRVGCSRVTPCTAFHRTAPTLVLRVWLVPKSSPANHAEIYGRAPPHRRRAVFNSLGHFFCV